jgi:hypothetical protein
LLPPATCGVMRAKCEPRSDEYFEGSHDEK